MSGRKIDEYRELLTARSRWDGYLLEHSGLPGPRGNIELARVVADLGTEPLFLGYLAYDAERAPTNDPKEFLAFCGVLGLGRLLAEGDCSQLDRLRRLASDPRWRIREAVAMALQRWGAVDMQGLIDEMNRWSSGSALEMRAAAAALCEPSLLQSARQCEQVLKLLDRITGRIAALDDRRSDEFQALRKGLGYCWSVAVAACPRLGKPMMEDWFASDDHDVVWIMKQNLRKKRLSRIDPVWTAQALQSL